MAEKKSTKRWEIRRALLGYTIQQENGTLTVIQPGQQMIFQGVRNGWGSVRIFGAGRTRRQYTGDLGKALEQAEEAFHHVGRAITLKNMPEGKACLCRMPFGPPVLLTAETAEDRLEIVAYAGRSPFAPLRRFWLLRAIERQLAESLTRVDAKPEPKPDKEKRKKQEKKKPETKKRVREKKQKAKKE